MATEQQPQSENNEPIKYGDVFFVSGQVANQPILPEDAAAMEAGERAAMGKKPHFSPASIMESAAAKNIKSGHVGSTSRPNSQGIQVTGSEMDGIKIVTESVNDQVIGHYAEPNFTGVSLPPGAPIQDKEAVTIGEVLEAVAVSAGDHIVDNADAAAIEAAEKRALGTDTLPPGSLTEEARHAAQFNATILQVELRTTMDDILRDAIDKLIRDKPVTQEDAKAILEAEAQNDPAHHVTARGVGEMMSAAANLNFPPT